MFTSSSLFPPISIASPTLLIPITSLPLCKLFCQYNKSENFLFLLSPYSSLSDRLENLVLVIYCSNLVNLRARGGYHRPIHVSTASTSTLYSLYP